MKRRQGFTLVELLVAMALIIFIMAILSSAFIAATTTFRNLKAAGDMAEKLRATTQLLQHDLAADHFEGKKRLSSPTFWLNGPPQQGYFQIWQGSPGTLEGSDLNTIGSYLTTNHALAFTIKLRGNQMGDYLTASSPLANNLAFGPSESRYETGTTYNYQWGEVIWFLQPSINPYTGQQDTTAPDEVTGAAPIPLYTLYRRQRLAVPDNSTNAIPVPGLYAQTVANCLEMSCWNNGGNMYYNTPFDLTVPTRRFGSAMPAVGTPAFYPLNYTTLNADLTALNAVNPTLNGADIQLTDVVSFDVRILPRVPPTGTPPAYLDPFITLFDAWFTTPTPAGGGFTYSAPTNFPTGVTGRVFDTWSSVNDGLSNYSQWNVLATPQAPNTVAIPWWNTTSQTGPNILAIQISIRIWDAKTNQTRQVTMVQAM